MIYQITIKPTYYFAAAVAPNQQGIKVFSVGDDVIPTIHAIGYSKHQPAPSVRLLRQIGEHPSVVELVGAERHRREPLFVHEIYSAVAGERIAHPLRLRNRG